MPDRETRTVLQSMELRESADGDFVLEALAAVTNVWTDIGSIRERIAPGAFRAALSKSDVVFNVNHGASSGVLARSTSGTLQLREGDAGLHIRAVMDRADPEVQSLVSKVRAGNLDAFSFAFTVTPDGQEWKGNDRTIRSFEQIYDTSIVERPAYDGTGIIAARSDAAEIALGMRDAHRIEAERLRLAWNRTLIGVRP